MRDTTIRHDSDVTPLTLEEQNAILLAQLEKVSKVLQAKIIANDHSLNKLVGLSVDVTLTINRIKTERLL